MWVTGSHLLGTGRKVGPTYWGCRVRVGHRATNSPAHAFAGAITFAIASSDAGPGGGLVGAVVLLVAYIVAGDLLSDLDSEYVAALLDPFGFRAFSLETKHWTAIERRWGVPHVREDYLSYQSTDLGGSELGDRGAYSLGVFVCAEEGRSTRSASAPKDGALAERVERVPNGALAERVERAPEAPRALPTLTYAIGQDSRRC